MGRSPFGSLLDWAERTFQTDVRYLIKGISWSSVAQVVVSLSALAVSVVVSRYVPKEVYGEYKFVLAFVSVLSVLSLNSLGDAVLRSTARGHDGALIEGFWQNLRWSVTVFIGALAAGVYYLVMGNQALALEIFIGGSLAPLLASANLYNAYFAGKRDFPHQSFYGGIFTTSLAALALVFVARFYPTPLALVCTYFIANVLGALFAYWRALRLYRPDPADRDPEMLTYGKHLSVIGILIGIAGNLDQLLLFHFAGAAMLAIYSFTIGILDQSKGPLKTLDSMMQARFATREAKSVRANLAQKCLGLLALSCVAILVYLPLAPYIYRFLFPNYMVAVPYSQLYAISLLSLAFSPAGSFLMAQKHVRAQYINAAVNALFQMAAFYVGIVYFGLWGLIWARVATRILGNAFTFALYLASPDPTA